MKLSNVFQSVALNSNQEPTGFMFSPKFSVLSLILTVGRSLQKVGKAPSITICICRNKKKTKSKVAHMSFTSDCIELVASLHDSSLL
jgi:hypothetical protein